MVNKKTGLVRKIGKNIGSTLIQSLGVTDIADKSLELLNKYVDQHSGDIRVPDLTGVALDDAEAILAQLGFKYASVLIQPKATLAEQATMMVLDTQPKANKKVAPGSFVKLYFMDEVVQTKSRELVQQAVLKKQQRKAQQAARVHNTVQVTKQNVGNMAQKVPLPKLKRKAKPTKQ